MTSESLSGVNGPEWGRSVVGWLEDKGLSVTTLEPRRRAALR
jgi:hypothetical protein